MHIRASVGLLLALLVGAATADAQAFRWVDDEGNPHYVGSLDQVPEQYRSQFQPPAEPTREAPVPVRGPVDAPRAATGECVLKVARTRTQPGSPPKPRLPSNRPSGISSKVTGECTLRVRGTEQHRGSSSSYPSCEACWKALDQMRGEAKSRAECNATSVESYK